MSITYIIFVLVCLAASVGLQLFIRKKMRELYDVERWLQAEFKGDLSDVGAILKRQKDKITFYKLYLFGYILAGCTVVFFLVKALFIPLTVTNADSSILVQIESGLVVYYAIISVILVLNALMYYFISPLPSELNKKLEDYVKRHREAYILDHLHDVTKVGNVLEDATYQVAQKIIQALKHNGKQEDIPLYLNVLIRSKTFENNLLGVEHLYLAKPKKALELLIFAYQMETTRIEPAVDHKVKSEDFGEKPPKDAIHHYANIPQKVDYELDLLKRIVEHPLLDQSYLNNLSTDILGMILIGILPITPLRLALTDHPQLVLIGLQKLTSEQIIEDGVNIIKTLKKLNDLSYLFRGTYWWDDDFKILSITPHEMVLKATRDRIYKVPQLKPLLALNGARPLQYYCKTCYEKSAVIAFGKYSYPVCPVCEKVGALELSVSFPVIVGVIGLKAYETRPESKEIHLPVWDETERKNLNAPIEVLEIRVTENLSYDWAVNAVYNTQRNLQPDRRIPIRLVGDPSLSQNSLLLLEQLKVGR